MASAKSFLYEHPHIWQRAWKTQIEEDGEKASIFLYCYIAYPKRGYDNM